MLIAVSSLNASWDMAVSAADAAAGALALLRCAPHHAAGGDGGGGDDAARVAAADPTEVVATAVRDRMAAARASLGVFGVSISSGTVRALLVVAVTNVGSFLYTRLK